MADVFISYARKDEAVAARLARAFESLGLSVWYDSKIAGGSEFSEVIEAEIEAARRVVVLWTEDAARSRWVRDEASLAIEAGKLLPVTLGGQHAPIGFRQIQSIPLDHWAAGKADDLPAALVEPFQAHSAGATGMVIGTGEGAGLIGQQPTAATVPAAGWWRSRTGFTAVLALLLVILAGGGLYLALGGEGDPAISAPGGRIAVLVQPFAASGTGGAEEAALASGITDELINRLRRVPGLQIATALADGSPSSAAFAEAHVVSGKIRINGAQMQVTARIADAAGTVLWSQTFDRPYVDIFDVQETIAASLANALSVPLDVGANSRANGGTSNPDAYAAYMQGVAHMFDGKVPLRYFEQAVRLDPQFQKALAALVTTLSFVVSQESDPTVRERLLARMDALSQQMLDANPDLANSYVARAKYLATVTDRDFVLGDTYFRRAMELDPGDDPQLRLELAAFEFNLGRGRNAADILASTELIDPVNAYSRDRLAGFLLTGDYRKVADLFDRIERTEGFEAISSHDFLAFAARVELDGQNAALDWLRQKNPAEAAGFAEIAEHSDFAAISPAEFDAWAVEHLQTGGQNAAIGAASVLGQVGRIDEAVHLLRIGLETPGNLQIWNAWQPSLAEARRTDAFERLMFDAGFVDAWRASGDWGDFCRPVSDTEISCR